MLNRFILPLKIVNTCEPAILIARKPYFDLFIRLNFLLLSIAVHSFFFPLCIFMYEISGKECRYRRYKPQGNMPFNPFNGCLAFRSLFSISSIKSRFSCSNLAVSIEMRFSYRIFTLSLTWFAVLSFIRDRSRSRSIRPDRMLSAVWREIPLRLLFA